MSKQKGFAVISGSSTVVAKIMENGTVVFGDQKPVSMRVSGSLVLDLQGQTGGTGKVVHVDSAGSASFANVEASTVLTTDGGNVQSVLNSLSSSLSSETSSRVSGDASLATKISVDVASAVSALVDGAPDLLNTLNELAAAIGDDANYATTVTNAVGSINTKVDSVNTALSNSISSEASRATSAEASLASAFASADTSLDNKLSSSISTEVSRATSVEDSLASAFSTADASLATSISSEVSRAQSAEGSLSSAFSTADASLATALSSETSSRMSGDNSLDARVDTLESVQVVGSAGEITVNGSESTAVGLSGTITIGLPDNVTVAGNLTVNGNATLGDSSDDQVTVNGKFRAPKFTAATIPAAYTSGDQTANNGHMFYLDAADDAVAAFPEGQKWYFCEDGVWFASPFYAV